MDPVGLFALFSLIQQVISRQQSVLSVAMTTLALNREAVGDHSTGGLFSNLKYLMEKCFCQQTCCNSLEDVVYCDQEHFIIHSSFQRGWTWSCVDHRALVFWIIVQNTVKCGMQSSPRRWHTFGTLIAAGVWHTWCSLGNRVGLVRCISVQCGLVVLRTGNNHGQSY